MGIYPPPPLFSNMIFTFYYYYLCDFSIGDNEIFHHLNLIIENLKKKEKRKNKKKTVKFTKLMNI